MNTMNALNFIREKLAFLILIALVMGLINGHFYPMEYSRLICISALILMILPIFVNLDIIKGLKQINKSIKTTIWASIFNFIIYPAIAYLIGFLFLKDYPAAWLGLVLLSLVPTSGMTIGWTYHTKGNLTTAMAIVSISILAAFIFLPFAVPFFTENILSTDFGEISREVILEKLFFIIIIPTILGTIIRKGIIKFTSKENFNKIKPVNASISAIGLLVVTFLVMSLKTTQSLTTNTNLLFIIVVPIMLFYAVIFAISHFVGNLFHDKEDSKAFFFSTAARYHVITLGVVLGAFQGFNSLGIITAVIAVGLAIQIPSLAFYARSLNKTH